MSVIELKDMAIDTDHLAVTVKGILVDLTWTEWYLICELARHIGEVVTYDHLLQAVWGNEYIGDTHILQVHIARLRTKLGGGRESYIHTRPRTGYVLG